MSETIKAIIVDDEKNSRQLLKSLLDKYLPEVLVLGSAENVEGAKKLIDELHPDLLFLDIQMPGGSGFMLLKQWEELPFDVIFVTSFDQYAINAIKYSALDYLLKPVKVSELRFAVEKAMNSLSKKTNKQQQIIALLENVSNDTDEKRIAIHLHDKVKLLNENRIAYIYADEGYCTLKMINGESYTTSKYLKDFEDLFAANDDFIRIHKKCIINVRHIKEYNKGEPCIIEMEDGQRFEVSRRKKQEILEKLKDRL